VIMGVALVSKVAVAAVLIPLFDHKFGNPALGAAVGLSLVEFSMTAAGLAFAPRVLQRRLVEPMARRVGFCALVGLATLVLLSPVSLLVASLAAAVVYAVCATLTGLTRHYLAVVLAQAGPLLTRRVATNEV
jgi:hypothetical protein